MQGLPAILTLFCSHAYILHTCAHMCVTICSPHHSFWNFVNISEETSYPIIEVSIVYWCQTQLNICLVNILYVVRLIKQKNSIPFGQQFYTASECDNIRGFIFHFSRSHEISTIARTGFIPVKNFAFAAVVNVHTQTKVECR